MVTQRCEVWQNASQYNCFYTNFHIAAAADVLAIVILLTNISLVPHAMLTQATSSKPQATIKSPTAREMCNTQQPWSKDYKRKRNQNRHTTPERGYTHMCTSGWTEITVRAVFSRPCQQYTMLVIGTQIKSAAILRGGKGVSKFFISINQKQDRC